MKNLTKLIPLCLVMLFAVGCASSGLNVASDKRLDADISEYDTYNWVSEAGQIPTSQIYVGSEGVLIFNNESTRSNIKEAIETQLEAKGFTREANNPDMLVNFTILEREDQLRTYTREGYTYLGEGPVERDVEMVEVEPGTILLNFVDADTGLQVWQGFASGALEESDIESESTIQAKIAAIFGEFDFSAFDLTES